MPSEYTKKILVYLPNIGTGIFRWLTWVARSATCVAWTTYTHWSSRFGDSNWIWGKTIFDPLYHPRSWRQKMKPLLPVRRMFTTSYFDCWKKNEPGEK